jgi:DNA-binding Xre family transcriptional regulator
VDHTFEMQRATRFCGKHSAKRQLIARSSPVSAAQRMTNPQRTKPDTIDKICAALGARPGDLFECVADSRAHGRHGP